MEEVFKDIKGFEGLYKVSNKGIVKSVKRIVDHGSFDTKRKIKEKIIKERKLVGIFGKQNKRI